MPRWRRRGRNIGRLGAAFHLAILLLGVAVFALGLSLASGRLYVYGTILILVPVLVFLRVSRRGAADRRLGGIRIRVTPEEMDLGDELRCSVQVHPRKPMNISVIVELVGGGEESPLREESVVATGPRMAEGETTYEASFRIPAGDPEMAWGLRVRIEESGVRLWEDGRSLRVRR